MPEVIPSQVAPPAEQEVAPPERGQSPEAQDQPKPIRSVRSAFGGLTANKGRVGIVFAIAAVVMVGAFALLNTSPKRKQVARRPVRQAQQRRSSDGLPDGPTAAPQQGLNATSGDVSAEAVQRTAQNMPNPGQQQSAESGASAQSGQPYQQGGKTENLGGVSKFQPPPVPGTGNGQWEPQPYSGSPAGSPPSEAAQQARKARRTALTDASITFVAQQPLKSQPVGAGTPGTIAGAGSSWNLGYRPGDHLSTHLENVASTAVTAPVIAIVDYDYQRNGKTIVPAGTRIIGTMSGSNETGLVSLRFNQLLLPNGRTVEISAVGLDHQLMPIKGFVTGRHEIEKFLLSALAGMGSTAAVFAGNNVNGQLTEADLMRMQAADSAGASITNYASELKQHVSQSEVVTVPAGTQVEVMFTHDTQKPGLKPVGVSLAK